MDQIIKIASFLFEIGERKVRQDGLLYTGGSVPSLEELRPWRLPPHGCQGPPHSLSTFAFGFGPRPHQIARMTSPAAALPLPLPTDVIKASLNVKLIDARAYLQKTAAPR